MQFMTGSKAEAAEEGAEIKEVDVATWELKSRHLPCRDIWSNQCNLQQQKMMSRQEKRCRDITTNSGTSQKIRADVMTSGYTCSKVQVLVAEVAT